MQMVGLCHVEVTAERSALACVWDARLFMMFTAVVACGGWPKNFYCRFLSMCIQALFYWDFQVPQQGPQWRGLTIFRAFFYMSVKLLTKSSPNKNKFHPFLGGPRKGAPPPCSPKWGRYGSRCPFPDPYLAYPLGCPLKEPSLQVPPIELQQRAMLHFQGPPSFIFHTPQYTSPFQVPHY
jgi:hypothetical protein